MPHQIHESLYVLWIYFVVLMFMQLSRLIFLLGNLQAFHNNGFWEYLRIFWFGMRFDLSTTALLNLPIILLLLFPLSGKISKYFLNISIVLILILNGLQIALNLMDITYFRFISKRTTFELFQFFGNSRENIPNILLQFLIDFWYFLVLFALIMYGFYRLLVRYRPRIYVGVRPIWYLKRSLILIVSLVLSVVFFRGGMQLKPIGLLTASTYTRAENIPLLINTPFSIIKTLNNKGLSEKHFMDDDQLESEFSPFHRNLKVNRFHLNLPAQPNFVILILESFGRDYVGFYNPEQKSCTPFLDSLLTKSFAFEGFANGRRSIEALPGILAGIPSLMDIDYPSSPYVNNKLNGLGSELGKLGYESAFFHGGNNGTMSFDMFAQSVGIQQYFGRNEYDNDSDFDGNWGIYDEPFLQFSAQKMQSFKQPFLATIFTLSSHHPYSVPEKYSALLESSANEMEAAITYSDIALRQFFKTASSMPWFKNTVFIITADHTPEHARSEYFRSQMGVYAVPLAFYSTAIDSGIRLNEMAQHIDILPTCMALANDSISKVFSFGRNVFDTIQKPFTVNYISGIYQYSDGNSVLRHDGTKAIGWFDLQNDPGLKENLILQKSADELNGFHFEAFLQQYNNRMIHNKLTSE
jgi:phosphoglycerol transferase MdoB-like AlkP superfamily enzyme